MTFNHLIKKDPEIDKMERDVFGQLEHICSEICPVSTPYNGMDIKFVSFEDALKELITNNF